MRSRAASLHAVPGWALAHDCEPLRPNDPSIVIDGSRLWLRVEHSIVGTIDVILGVIAGLPADICIADSIVDATSETGAAIGIGGCKRPFVYRDGQLGDFVKALEDSARQLADVFGAGAPDQKACADAQRFFDTWEQIGPLMRARARFDARNLDPCAIPADGQFRSRENQLYRVEIHKGGMAGDATFKWSRENGSVEFALSAAIAARAFARAGARSLSRAEVEAVCSSRPRPS
ncbi:DUF6519 domain-containing protein [Bradyrhizobium barranii]|uniref:DUF6519 domain-containing protein n=1 Tax=Bradyrhizobium barranii TaxID=2992140 RepID=UPI00140B18F3|nr:DUF6519 domain-containing protein [Bradyrhizobium barranii]